NHRRSFYGYFDDRVEQIRSYAFAGSAASENVSRVIVTKTSGRYEYGPSKKPGCQRWSGRVYWTCKDASLPLDRMQPAKSRPREVSHETENAAAVRCLLRRVRPARRCC